MKNSYLLIVFLFFKLLAIAQCDIVMTMNPIQTNCFESCDGIIEFSFINNGTDAAPYVAVVKNSSLVTVATNTFFNENGAINFDDLCAGDYTVSIQSVFTPACYYESPITITQPTQLVIDNVNITHENLGMSNGVVTVNVSGGTPPYQYSLNNGSTFQASNSFTGLSNGVYFLVVEDANGCQVNQTVSIGIIESLGCEVVADVSSQPVSCFGTCDGELLVDYQNLNMTPGSPYTITVEDSDGMLVASQTYFTEAQTHLFTGLCADLYTVAVQGVSCSFIITSEVSSPGQIAVFTNINQPTFGETNGVVQLVQVGGVSPYVYSIDGGTSFQASSYFYNLDEGTYNAIVQDANGCEQPLILNLSDPTTCVSSISANVNSHTSCVESCDGEISFSYNYNLLHGPYSVDLISFGNIIQTKIFNSISGSDNFENVCAGNYEIKVTDDYGCTVSDFVTVNEPTQVMINSVSTNNADQGNNNGDATISSTGGTLPFSYSINGINYFSNTIFSNLTGGIYTAYVQDGNGCTDEFTFVINENLGCNYAITIDADSISCPASCDGNLHYEFDGSSSDSPFYAILELNGTVIETAFHPAAMVDYNMSDLCEGDYILTIGNSNGCEQIFVGSIQSPNAIEVVTSIEIGTTNMNDGVIYVQATGGNLPYEYSIDNQSNWQSSSTFNSLYGGNYFVWVQDTKGCLGWAQVEVDDTSSCPSIINTILTTETSCGTLCDASLTCTFLDVFDNPPYVIELFKGSTSIDTSDVINTFSGIHQFNDLCSGAYTVMVTDADGCADKQNVYIYGQDPLLVTNVTTTNTEIGESNGSVIIDVTGGTAPYQFSINSGVNWQYENTIENLDEGFYVVSVKDANDCIYLHTFTINEQPGCNIVTTFNLVQEVTCHDSCDAVINYSFSEAISTPPYQVELIYFVGPIETYNTTSNSFSGILDSLCQGVYGIKVTNGNGCYSEIQTAVVTLPEDLYLTGTITNASFGGSDGSIDLIATGGTGQQIFTINGTNFQETSVFDNLPAGIYQAVVMDENQCEDFLNFEIVEGASCSISLNTVADISVNCPGDCSGSISYNYSDIILNAPYTITLKNSLGEIIDVQFKNTITGNGLFTNLCAGDFVVTVSDVDGCESNQSISTIGQPNYLDVDVVIVQPTDGYYNGSITLNPTGGTAPFEYSTNNQATWGTANMWTSLNAGFYVIYVKDANGCIQVICVVLTDFDPSLVTEINQDISVYPNPTRDFVFINATNIESILVYDIQGKLVQIDQLIGVNGTSIDLSFEENGMYIIEIRTNQDEIYRVKVVKH